MSQLPPNSDNADDAIVIPVVHASGEHADVTIDHTPITGDDVGDTSATNTNDAIPEKYDIDISGTVTLSPAKAIRRKPLHPLGDDKHTPVPFVDGTSTGLYKLLESHEINANVTLLTIRRIANTNSDERTKEEETILSETLSPWAERALQGDYILDGKGNFMHHALRQGKWQQDITHKAVTIGVGTPNIGISSGDTSQTRLTGDMAIIKIRAACGLGGSLQIPLIHSGVWLTLKTSSVGEYYQLLEKLAGDKLRLGWKTQGYAFSNHGVFIQDSVFDFVVNNTYECSVKGWSREMLRRLIKQTDIPITAWGLASTMYPNGYDFEQPCIIDPVKCNHLIRERIALPFISWYNDSAITTEMRAFMVNRERNSRTEEEVLAYQKMVLANQSAPVSVSDKNKIVLHIGTPSVQASGDSGAIWLANIESMMDEVLARNLSKDEKEVYLERQSTLASLGQFAHWIQRVDVDSGFIDDQPTIQAFLRAMSSDPELIKKCIIAIRDHMAKSVVNLIAIPEYVCPNCNKAPTDENKAHPWLTPIDPVRLFFILARYYCEGAMASGKE